MLCATCGEVVEDSSCAACGSEPLLAGRYALLDIRGQGGLGVTYRARDTETEQIVAVKELPMRPQTPAKLMELFEREARVLRQLDHPSIPKYLAHFQEGHGKHRALYLVQQFVDGQDLHGSLEATRYSVRDVLKMMLEVLDPLMYLHALAPPVLHRDLKPRNLVRAASGRLFVVDFGSVRDAMRDDDLGGSTVAGTFGFMAPEQFMGQATPATDLYGLGATAVALLTRKPLHTLLDHNRALDWTSHAHLSEPVSALLQSLLATDPAKRPRSAREVSKVLGELLDSDAPENAPSAPEVSVVEPTQLPVLVDLQTAVARPEPARGLAVALMGSPTEVRVELTVPGAVSPAHHARLTAVIEATADPGRVETIGEMYRWSTAQAQNRMVRVTVVDMGDGTTRIQAWERLSGRAGALFGGIMGSVGGGLGGGLSAPVAMLAGPIAGAAWITAAVLGSYLAARLLLQSTYRDRQGEMERIAQDIAAFMGRLD